MTPTALSIPMGISIDETTGEPLPPLPTKPYTVLVLLVPLFEVNVSVHHVTAVSPEFAVEAAKAAAMFDSNGIKDADDLGLIGVLDGHHTFVLS